MNHSVQSRWKQNHEPCIAVQVNHDPPPPESQALQPPVWLVARDLKWIVARGYLLDPILWLGTLTVGWALGQGPRIQIVPGLVILFVIAATLANSLLFASKDNELLRTQPLGRGGLLRVRLAELRWQLIPLRAVLLLALVPHEGWLTAALVWAASHLLDIPSIRLAVLLRMRGRKLPELIPNASEPEAESTKEGHALEGNGASLPLGLRSRKLSSQFEFLASEAVSASPRRRGALWNLLERLLPLPRRIRSRVVRDLVLLLRGQDLRGAFLIAASPASYIVLRDELAVLRRPELVGWRTLTCAALGGAAVAYAVGPGIHLVRNQVISWERVSRTAGRSAVRGALAYALGFAALHSVGTLIALALASNGRFADHVPGLIAPVLILELAMAHFVVVFTMGASSGRKVHGEGTLVLALPIVAVGVAIFAWFSPWIAALYFLVTGGMAAQAILRYEKVEVSW